MSFNVRKAGNSFKLSYIGNKGRVTNVNKLPAKDKLQTMDVTYLGQPFVNVTSKSQDTRGLDFTSFGQIFYANNNGYAISSNRINVSSNHEDVNNWLYRISIFGGSASQRTINALNAFCYSIDSAGIRNRFYRLNLFCGDNLNACLVPLYISPNNNIQYGFLRDTNYFFVNSDYVETGSSAGLTSTGADIVQQNVGTKYLDTGLKPNNINPQGFLPSNMHLSASVSTIPVSANTTIVFYNTTDYTDIYSLGIQLLGGNAALRTRMGSNNNNITLSPVVTSGISTPMNFYISSITAINDFRTYINGSNTSTNANTTTTIMTGYNSILIFRQTAGYYGNMRLMNYSMGLGLDSTQSPTYSNILSTFNTALNRT